MTTVTLGNLEGRMCGHLLAAVALFVTQHQKEAGSGERGLFIDNQDMGDWKFAAGVFKRLGIMVTAPGALFARFDMDAVEMPDYLAATMAPGDPRVADVIEAFVGMGGYGDRGDTL